MNGLRAIGHTTCRPASISDNAQGSAAIGYTREWVVSTGHTAYRTAVIPERTHWPATARYIAHGPVGCWVARARDDGRRRKTARSLAVSGHTVCRRATRVFKAAGFTAGWLTTERFCKGLWAVVHEPGVILTAAGDAEDLSTAHVCRAEGNGRAGWDVAGISERSRVAVAEAVVTASHSELERVVVV